MIEKLDKYNSAKKNRLGKYYGYFKAQILDFTLNIFRHACDKKNYIKQFACYQVIIYVLNLRKFFLKN